MANSLEVMVPFLDHEICEFIFQLRTSVYYRANETKHLLFKNIKDHFPQALINRKKQGFVGPDKYYMNMEWYHARLAGSKLVSDGDCKWQLYPKPARQQRPLAPVESFGYGILVPEMVLNAEYDDLII